MAPRSFTYAHARRTWSGCKPPGGALQAHGGAEQPALDPKRPRLDRFDRLERQIRDGMAAWSHRLARTPSCGHYCCRCEVAKHDAVRLVSIAATGRTLPRRRDPAVCPP
jgi:hypothetical protein